MGNELTTPQVDRHVKVVLLGAPGSGKAAIVKAVAAAHVDSVVRVGDLGESRIFRTEFTWMDPAPGGGALLVRVFGLAGAPDYNAISELLMARADAVVFVANPSRVQAVSVKEAFQSLLFNARNHGIDLQRIPVAFQYHMPHPGPGSDPDEMDRYLGIAPGAVARFVTRPGEGGGMGAAVEWVVTQLAQERAAAEAAARRGAVQVSRP